MSFLDVIWRIFSNEVAIFIYGCGAGIAIGYFCAPIRCSYLDRKLAAELAREAAGREDEEKRYQRQQADIERSDRMAREAAAARKAESAAARETAAVARETAAAAKEAEAAAKEAEANRKVLKDGYYWDRHGNVFCPACQTPMREAAFDKQFEAWRTYCPKCSAKRIIRRAPSDIIPEVKAEFER